MDSEIKIIIAFLFNRTGKTNLKESDMYLSLSMELGWFSLKESQEFVKYAIRQELLAKKNGMVYPTFPYQKIVIPLGFIPKTKQFSKKIELQKDEDIVENIITQIITQTTLNREEILEEIKQEQKEKNLFSEVAALYVAKKHFVEIMKWYDIVEKMLNKQKK